MILGFKIDWDLERNKMRFRTHWVSGWFIDSLKYHHHIDLSDAMPRLARVMNDLADERALTHARVTHFQQHHSHVAHLCNDIVIQTIDTLERYSLRHTVLAKKMSEEVDEWILELERRIQALPGANPEVTQKSGFQWRLKGPVSMERKLGSALAEMMQEHNDSNFAPTYNVLMGSIRDALRYTFVVEPDVYCAAVRLTEQYLIDKGCTLTAKNFWQDPPDPKDRKTMYMGLNMHMHLAPSEEHRFKIYKHHSYPVELQIHTPESFELKNGESHLIYEDIRTEHVQVRVRQLIQQAYALWEPITVPKNAQGSSFATYCGPTGNYSDQRKQIKVVEDEDEDGGPEVIASDDKVGVDRVVEL